MWQAFGNWFRAKMLQTCHLACIEDDSEREAFIQRVGAVTNVQAYRKLLTDPGRTRMEAGSVQKAR